MEEKLITSFNHLREFPFGYVALKNLRLMRLSEEEKDKLIEILNNTYSSGITSEELNEVFNSENINAVRKWLGKPRVDDEVYPKYYLLTSQVKKTKLYIFIDDFDPQVEEETMMDDDFWGCNPQYLGTEKPETDEEIKDVTFVSLDEFRYDEKEMWNSYHIPVYAIDRICKEVLDPDDKLDYYERPDTFAINELTRYIEVEDDEKKAMNEFISQLKKRMPEGFDIVWDEQSCGSPSFYRYPAFGEGCECVKIRVYPKNLDRLKV